MKRKEKKIIHQNLRQIKKCSTHTQAKILQIILQRCLTTEKVPKQGVETSLFPNKFLINIFKLSVISTDLNHDMSKIVLIFHSFLYLKKEIR